MHPQRLLPRARFSRCKIWLLQNYPWVSPPDLRTPCLVHGECKAWPMETPESTFRRAAKFRRVDCNLQREFALTLQECLVLLGALWAHKPALVTALKGHMQCGWQSGRSAGTRSTSGFQHLNDLKGAPEFMKRHQQHTNSQKLVQQRPNFWCSLIT